MTHLSQMGTRRQRSSDRLKLRLDQDSEAQDTLIPCKACGTDGRVIVETESGSYFTRKCQWCEDGYTHREVVAMFERWTRILRHNQNAGKCRKTV